MRWITFVIAAYLFVCVQFALGALLGWREATPNLVLILVTFVALHAKLRTGLIAGLIAGLMHDVVAGHGMGTYALAYPLIVALAAQMRDVMYADLAATHATSTFLLGAAIAVYLETRHFVRVRFFPEDPPIAFWRQMLGALASAAVAIPVIAMLRKFRRAFGFSSR